MDEKKIATYFLAVMKNERSGFLAVIVRFIFRIASFFFGVGVWLRNWAFDQGWMCRFFPPVPLVISIGNITAGGTGKTPMTLMMAKEFYNGFAIAILTRGYLSKAEHLPKPTCLSNGKGPLHPASLCGDEPLLLAQNLPNASIYVGKNRQASSMIAAQGGAQLILLDDGMQYRQLARDIDIVMLDNNDLFGNGHFLPRGFLRESPKALKRAHLIVINHVENETQLLSATEKIAPYTQAPVVGTALQSVAAWYFSGEKIDTLEGKRIAIFCGIAHPKYFKNSIEKEGGTIVAETYARDHESFKISALEAFALQAQKMNADFLLCTEKDRVKLSAPMKLSLPLAWLQVELKVVAGTTTWNKFIQKAKRDILQRM